LAELAGSSKEESGVHPLLLKAEQEGVNSQLADLRTELEEYDELRAGKYTAPALDSFVGFPLALIKSRIAKGLTQKELAERLGLKEQQIQRYESTEYASASLSRVREVAEALGVKLVDDFPTQHARISLPSFISRLGEAGVDRDLLLKRLLPISISEQIAAESDTTADALVYRAAFHVGRVFGWTPRDILGPRESRLDMKLAAASLKITSRADGKRVSAYLVYAHYLALTLLPTMKPQARKMVPADPYETREAVLAGYGALTLSSILQYLWNLGMLVLPLNDPGVFHGAYFREGFRNMIVLKQRTTSASRWMFDALHEAYHTLQEPRQPSLSVIEHDDMSQDRVSSEDERTASQYAGAVLLGKQPQKLAELCLREAGRDIRMLKSAVRRVATAEDVPVDALGNYMAFRLSLEGHDWWGTAENLQIKGPNPFSIARDILLERVDLSRLAAPDLQLLQRALVE
jgi:transcriptional regulator with XRE-family HTH domain